MYMGTNAFLFYFPVVRDFLLTKPPGDWVHDEAWILAKCIRQQFDADTIDTLRALVPEIINMSVFIRRHPEWYGWDQNEEAEVVLAWAELSNYVETLQERTRRTKE
jgi:hypothetical protein